MCALKKLSDSAGNKHVKLLAAPVLPASQHWGKRTDACLLQTCTWSQRQIKDHSLRNAGVRQGWRQQGKQYRQKDKRGEGGRGAGLAGCNALPAEQMACTAQQREGGWGWSPPTGTWNAGTERLVHSQGASKNTSKEGWGRCPY